MNKKNEFKMRLLKDMFYTYNYDYLSGNLGADPIGEKLYRLIPQSAIDINEGLSSDDQNPGINGISIV